MIDSSNNSSFSSFADVQALLQNVSMDAESQTVLLENVQTSMANLQSLRTTQQSSYLPLYSPTSLNRSESLEWLEFYCFNQNQKSPNYSSEQNTPPGQKRTRTPNTLECSSTLASSPKRIHLTQDQVAEALQQQDSKHPQNKIISLYSVKNLHLSLLETTYNIHELAIQTLLRDTQKTLTDYFSTINDPKKIYMEQHHPTFLALPIEYTRIQAAAEKAFADHSYRKDYPRDGCYARAELITIDLDIEGYQAGKIFVTESDLYLQHPTFKNIAWNYHVAAVATSKEDHQLWVIDPCVSKAPLLLPHWLETFVVGDTAKLTCTHASYRYTAKDFITDPSPFFDRAEKAKTALAALPKIRTTSHH
jgi:Glutaminase